MQIERGPNLESTKSDDVPGLEVTKLIESVQIEERSRGPAPGPSVEYMVLGRGSGRSGDRAWSLHPLNLLEKCAVCPRWRPASPVEHGGGADVDSRAECAYDIHIYADIHMIF